MEEKERYRVEERFAYIHNDKCGDGILDILTDYEIYDIEQITVLLNQQSMRIKELEKALKQANTNNYLTDFYLVAKENKKLKQQLSLKMEELHIAYCGIENVKTKNGNLKEEIKKLKQSQKQLAVENCEFKKEKLYFDLLFTRLHYIHKQADEFREEKERYGIKDMALDSIWRVFDLQKHDCCEYEEMSELETGIESIANDELLRNIEHDLQFKPTRTVDEIFEEIQKIDNQIKELKGEK
jgi:hypothetical protein